MVGFVNCRFHVDSVYTVGIYRYTILYFFNIKFARIKARRT